jgi:DNA-directed RNA polymerase sigma subunit (sigma70/sigma32)
MPREKRDIPRERLTAMTLREIAEEMGCTPQYVGEIERRALVKLRVVLLNRKIVTREGRYCA